jgi:hypothetical protein
MPVGEPVSHYRIVEKIGTCHRGNPHPESVGNKRYDAPK